MYEPVFNSVLVQIDDKDADWGGGNDDSMLGKSFSKGKIIRVGTVQSYKDTLLTDISQKASQSDLDKLAGKSIMWNEGVEAGTTFEFDGKLFGFIYWWDIRGVLIDDEPKYSSKAKDLIE